MDEERESRWGGWGDPAQAIPLPSAIKALLGALNTDPVPTIQLSEIHPAPSRVDPQGLTAIVGAEHVYTDDATRSRRSAGKSTPDLLRQRKGDVSNAPDVVVCPGSHDEVVSVLAFCAGARLAVVPHGGGTSVVGGLAPQARGFPGVVALDLRRLDRLVEVDPVSRTATLQAGVRAPEAENLLKAHGFTLGHFPQSFEYATIGGFAATRSSGQASAGYGRFDSMVVALTVATPVGTIEAGRAPAGAAGPDLRQLFLGSEGALGIITSVTVRVRPIPAEMHYEGWRFESFEAGLAAMRKLAQDGPLPTVLRLSDEFETTLQHSSDGCLMIVGSPEKLAIEGAAPLGSEVGEKWLRGRYAGPYLRDALIDAGAFVETLETAAFWSRIPQLYQAVRNALIEGLDGPAFVLCHVSHVYETGASLYFTVVSPMVSVDQWNVVKAKASDAILANGGTISHHHGVGTDHRDWYVQEAGELAVEALRAVKRQLDPHGILNPGVLIP
ncbi:MAG TPA: FAD-binding oxidoreductase [Micromonosporaceae bacterium]|nr:FAD-binding oxidoreductase [Micromonosporaceae bacterium]